MNNTNMIKVGGWSIVIFTLLYLALQVFLHIVYNYPAIPHGAGKELIPVLLNGGLTFQILLTVFALLPLLLIPGSVGIYYAFKDINKPNMLLSVIFASMGIFTFILSLLRWPSLNWSIAHFYQQAVPADQASILVLFASMNSYWGIFLAGFLAKICFSIWFFLVSAAMLKVKDMPKWMGYLGIIAGIYVLASVFMLLGIIPIMTYGVLRLLAPLEFLWMMVLGISLLYYKKQ
jgi:hypothetical protein